MPPRYRVLVKRAIDVVLPIAAGLLLFGIVTDAYEGEHAALQRSAGIVLAVIPAAALWWRRSHPELVAAITIAGALCFQLIAPEGVVPFVALIGLGALAAHRSPRVSLPALVVLVAITTLNFATTTNEDALFTMTLPVAAWALGEAARSRRVAIDQEARRAVGEERARIARELHDVIAHSVSVIVVQAAAADDVFDERPDQARAALRAIEASGRDALRELRVLLADVRPGAEPRSADPQPGVDRLDELARPLRDAGLQVAVRLEGPARPLPAGVDLSAYRIVQEALTNTLRHARATHAEVTLRYTADGLEVDVCDDGQPASVVAGHAGGQGLVGMRERAAMLGGSLEAGPLPRGGYRVHAHLPLEPAS